MKQKTEIERLLVWAYRDELPKRDATSSAEGIWDLIAGYGARGGVDIGGHGSAQRYAQLGVPHPDALEVERAVANLPDAVIDWEADAEPILGDLLALADPRRCPPKPRRSTVVRWNGARVHQVPPPREVLLVRSLRTSALVIQHARMGTRPDWQEGPPRPVPVLAATGGQPAVMGVCKGRNRYTIGSFCPLRYEPSPLSIAAQRADYVAWWRGLNALVGLLASPLVDHVATEAVAPELPWRNPGPTLRVWYLGGAPANRERLEPSRSRTAVHPPRSAPAGRPPLSA